MAIQPSRKAIFCTDSIIRYNIIILNMYDWRFAFSKLQISIETIYGHYNDIIIQAFIYAHVYVSTS